MRGFSWRDCRDLVVRSTSSSASPSPIVLIWDNLNVHRAAGMRECAAEHDWPTIVNCLPWRWT
jgi:putative transposase